MIFNALMDFREQLEKRTRAAFLKEAEEMHAGLRIVEAPALLDGVAILMPRQIPHKADGSIDTDKIVMIKNLEAK